MQKYFKRARVAVALLFFIAILISFFDVKGNLPSAFQNSALYLQFTASVLKFITPGTALSIGFIVVIAMTLIGGRIYCSTICPLGVLQDIIIFIRRKFTKKQQLRFKKALNVLRYSILILTLLSITFSGVLLINLLDPYAIFGRIGTHVFQPAALLINNFLASFSFLSLPTIEYSPFSLSAFIIALTMLFIIVWFAGTSDRLFCNSVCPVGTLLGFLSKFSIFKIKIAHSTCTQCGKCQTVCKANCIDIKNMEVDETRCISCFNCIPVCDLSGIKYKRLKTVPVKTPDNKKGLQRRILLTAVTSYAASKAIPFNTNEISVTEEDLYFDRGPVAPPGAKSIEHLKERCISCHLCVAVCPTKVLQPSFLEYGFTGINIPQMDYNSYFCNFDCHKCGEVCPTGAIITLPQEEKHVTQIGKVHFQVELCIVESEETSCGSCSEHCPTQAVKMVDYNNDLTIPKIDPNICIGCGACEYACPVTDPHKAIYVVSNPEHLIADKPKQEKIEFNDTEEFPF